MARLSRIESRAQTRAALLKAARRQFARKGYGGASVDEIAEEASFSKGAFYSNFESKEAIFLALLDEHMRAEIEAISAIVFDGSTPDDLLARLGAFLSEMNTDGDWAMLTVELQLHARRSASFAVAFYALQDRQRDEMGRLLAEVFRRAERAPPLPPREIAAAFIAISLGMAIQEPRGSVAGNPDPSGKAIRVLLDSLVTAAPTKA